jgi:putative copper export protein
LLVGATLVRWFEDASLAGVIGSLSFGLFVLPPAARAGGWTTVQERVRTIFVLALTVLVLASAAELVLRASTMAGGGIRDGLDALPLVLTKSHFGAAWTARFIALGLLALSCAWTTRACAAMALVLALVVSATSALSGHLAEWGDLRAIVANDWLHVTASALWTGGLLCLTMLPFDDPRAPCDLTTLAAVAGRFSRLAGLCLLAVVVTGVANACVQLADVAALWRTPYGRALEGKLVLVSGLVALGAANRYRVLPRMRREDGVVTPEAFAARRRFARYVVGEVVFAALVFGCTAFLGQLPPPVTR